MYLIYKKSMWYVWDLNPRTHSDRYKQNSGFTFFCYIISLDLVVAQLPEYLGGVGRSFSVIYMDTVLLLMKGYYITTYLMCS